MLNWCLAFVQYCYPKNTCLEFRYQLMIGETSSWSVQITSANQPTPLEYLRTLRLLREILKWMIIPCGNMNMGRPSRNDQWIIGKVRCKEGFLSQIKYHIETKPFLHGGVCIYAGTVKIDEVKMHFLPLKFSKKKQTNVQLCP